MATHKYLSRGTTVCGDWTIQNRIGSGSYGVVYAAVDRHGNRAVVKIDKHRGGTVEKEASVLTHLNGIHGFPEVYATGHVRHRYVIVMQNLGLSLEALSDYTDRHFTTRDILKIGIQMVDRLRDLHETGFVHRDIHPGNLLVGDQRSGEGDVIYMVDFGESSRRRDCRQGPRGRYGHPLFASVNALQKKPYSQKDDIESLVYTLVCLHNGDLPWFRIGRPCGSNRKIIRECIEMRKSLTASEICGREVPKSIVHTLKSCLLYTSPSPRDQRGSRMPSSA